MDKKADDVLYRTVGNIIEDSNQKPIEQRPEGLKQLKAVLADVKEEDLDRRLLSMLKNGLVGGYGSEYLLSPDGFEDLIQFYSFLHVQYPNTPEIMVTLADLLLMEDRKDESFDMFNQAFYLKPCLIGEAPGELQILILDEGTAEQQVCYQIACMRCALLDEDIDAAKYRFQELLQITGAGKALDVGWQCPEAVQQLLQVGLTEPNNLTSIGMAEWEEAHKEAIQMLPLKTPSRIRKYAIHTAEHIQREHKPIVNLSNQSKKDFDG